MSPGLSLAAWDIVVELGAKGEDNISDRDALIKIEKYGVCKGTGVAIYTGSLQNIDEICKILWLNLALY